MKAMKKSVTVAVGALLVGMSGAASANVNPFGFTDLGDGYQQTQQVPGADKHKKGEGEAKCGEGRCGEAHKAAHSKLKADGKCGAEMKCGEGKCGEDKAKRMKDKAEKAGEGKCGEGKCGEGKCGER